MKTGEQTMRYTVNAAKSQLLGDGVYVRRWHGNGGLGVEIGTRNGDREFDQVFLSPAVIQELTSYLAALAEYRTTTQPPADERAA